LVLCLYSYNLCSSAAHQEKSQDFHHRDTEFAEKIMIFLLGDLRVSVIASFFSSWCLGVLVVKSSLSSGSVESRILDRYWPHREAGSDMRRIDDMTENTPRGLVGPVTELSKGVPGSLEE